MPNCLLEGCKIRMLTGRRASDFCVASICIRCSHIILFDPQQLCEASTVIIPILFYSLDTYLFIWLLWPLVVVCRIFQCNM